ncbi:helix-turn-helix domain-containing protein [Actinomadura sp. B10D3]|uniref:helix-turn-helix domain-containing protein n=1 Tax=Actinomadura sp. B10D3 TaxID=3153557 RepID=UPI00325C5591
MTRESVLTRAVLIFEAFDPDHPALSVSEIARRTGLHVATASRLVAQLVEHGLLARDEQRRVRVGMRLWELASRAAPTLGLREAAMPFMEDLHAVLEGEPDHRDSILDDGEREAGDCMSVCVSRSRSDRLVLDL